MGSITNSIQAVVSLATLGLMIVGARVLQNAQDTKPASPPEPADRRPHPPQTGKSQTVMSEILNQHLQETHERPLALPPSRPMDGKLVLVVDDAPDNRLLIQSILRRVGAQTVTANDGAEGVDKALSSHPDAVIMDIQMPKMDGFEASQRLRELGFDKPIISCTARGLADDEAKSATSGCDAHLRKPLERQALLRLLGELWGPGGLEKKLTPG